MTQDTKKTNTQSGYKPDYVIKKRRSNQWYWAVSLLILAILSSAIFLGYKLNENRYDFSETAEKQFSQSQVALKEANSSAIRWQQQYEIEKAINKQLRQHTLDMEIKLNNRNKEVQAYQRIFDPDSVTTGLQIASFGWEVVAKDQFSYRLILIQAKQQVATIKGKFDLTLVGSENGQDKEINFNQLESLAAKDRKFSFKYMEARNGVVNIPANFEPKLVRVSVTSSGRQGKTILQDFAWEQITAPSNTNSKSNNTNPKSVDLLDTEKPTGGK